MKPNIAIRFLGCLARMFYFVRLVHDDGTLISITNWGFRLWALKSTKLIEWQGQISLG